jgi:hypothetical protein
VLNEPQSWNGYAYTRNNPVRYSDPTGKTITICSPDGKDCKDHENKDFRRLRKHCEKSSDCVIVDDRKTGGRIFEKDENGEFQLTATFANELDGQRGGAFVDVISSRETWDNTGWGILFNYPIGKVIRGFRGRGGSQTPNSSSSPAKSAANVSVKPLGRGSTGRTAPKNLKEQLAMEQATSNPTAGDPVFVKGGMQDSRWQASDGWVKMRQTVNGVEIHYVRNTRTGEVADFKFKD